MAFTTSGVNEAPELVPSSFGILSVAKPENAPSEDRWIRGFAQEYNSTITSLVNWDDTDSTSGTLISGGAVNYYDDIKPFFIEATEDRSTLGFMGVDRVANLKKKLEAGTQKALERELSLGAIRIGESHDNKALVGSTAGVLNSGTALSVKRAVALLEERMGALSDFGLQGVIHMTRDAASLLASNSQMVRHNEQEGYLETFGNTPIIVGSGYTGAGPVSVTDGTQTASATNKWIYGTGTVKVFLGDVDVVNDNLAQAYDVSGNANDMRIKAIRPAAVYFDTSIHLAVRVDLTA
jgi:hypothetical protein